MLLLRFSENINQHYVYINLIIYVVVSFFKNRHLHDTVPMTYIRIPEYTYLIISTPIEHWLIFIIGGQMEQEIEDDGKEDTALI